MAVRTIEYTVNADGIEPAVKQFAGVQNEHKATKLVFNIQNELYANLIAQSDEYGARLIYRFDGYDGEGGVCRSDTSELIGTQVTYPLEEWLTRFGGVVKVVLVLSILKENLTEMELYSFPALLQLKNLPSGGDIDKTEYESLTTLAENAKSAADKLFGDNVFVFGGGNAYDENIWPPTTDEVHNPEVNLVQSKRPITSKGVYAAFKAFFERVIQPIKDYIVEEGTTDDGWTYEKRNSGVVKCWYVGPAVTISWGGEGPLYYSTNTIWVDFPEGLFIAKPCVTPCFETSKGYVTTNLISVGKNLLTVAFGRTYGGNDDIQGHLHIKVVGRWK